eukprot:g13210.t1
MTSSVRLSAGGVPGQIPGGAAPQRSSLQGSDSMQFLIDQQKESTHLGGGAGSSLLGSNGASSGLVFASSSSSSREASSSNVVAKQNSHPSPLTVFFGVTEQVRKSWILFCRWISNNNSFAVLMTLLTLYALVGDDLRLALTEKQHDQYFNMMTYLSLAIFTCSFGKNDYYGGFFFYLDIVSTLSLILDITWLAEELFTSPEEEGGSGGGGGGVARVGRASRMGTRMGRVVRVIRVLRLVRIFKLYKAHLERKRKREAALLAPGERQVFADAGEEEDEVEESRVGKKLSEMTTRRVILVVLVMLIAVPLFIKGPGAVPRTTCPARGILFRSDGFLSEKDVYMDAATYAATGIWTSFREYIVLDDQVMKMLKEKVMSALLGDALEHRYSAVICTEKHLHFLYYHNWHGDYSGSDKANPHSVKDRVFWVGYLTNPESQSCLNCLEIAERARLGSSNSSDYYHDADVYADQESLFESKPIPEEHKQKLMQVWDRNCEEKMHLMLKGVSYRRLRYGASVAYPQDKPCPRDLRYNEIQLVGPMAVPNLLLDEYQDLEKMVFVWYLDLTPWTSLEAVFNMGQTLFVLVCLLVGSMLFAKDANKLVLRKSHGC